MGEYNKNHYLHYVCVDCRIGSKSMHKSLKCPHCAKLMQQVGVTFQIPKKTDDKRWKKVGKELRKGNGFWSIWWAR